MHGACRNKVNDSDSKENGSRRLCSHHWRSTMSAETVCCGWVSVAVLVLWLFHIRSKSLRKLNIHYPVATHYSSCAVAPSCQKAGCVSEIITTTILPSVQEMEKMVYVLQMMAFLLIVVSLYVSSCLGIDVELNTGPLDQGEYNDILCISGQLSRARL